MEPLSIAAACSTLINNIAPLTAKIAAFVASVRDAREDMDATLRELSSLFLCLNTLRDSSTNVQYPEIFRGDLLAIIGHCDIVANQMLGLLDTLSSRNLARRIQWSAMGKDRMGQLRSSLETHKTALSLALSMTTMCVHFSLFLWLLPFERLQLHTTYRGSVRLWVSKLFPCTVLTYLMTSMRIDV
jgi:hypothetical protein